MPRQSLPELQTNTAMRRSVQEFPDVDGGAPRVSTIFQIATAADEAPVWWSPARDKYLDKFWPTEPFLAGAIFSIASRNAAFRYELTGPRNQVVWAQQLLSQADFGDGWQSFIMKVTLDLLCQGNGAVFEIVRPARIRTKTGTYDAIKAFDEDTGDYLWQAYDRRTGKLQPCSELTDGFKVLDSPLDLPIGIAHLDAQRCVRTGDPDFPIVYTDLKGKAHKLAAHQVVTMTEMPSPREDMRGVQHCLADRALRLSQTLRDMLIYKHEKISGRFARAIYLTNIDAQLIQDAIDQSKANADNRGLIRYMQPIIATTLKPDAKPAVAMIELASLPDGFDEETTMRWYIAGLALAAGVDYGFLAPLPGNRLGTATQAETQERQAKGKSSRLFLNALTHKLNFSGILPRNVTIRFAVPDPYEESERDRALARRARARSIMIKSQEITPEMARQIAADVGDIDPKYLEAMGETDVTPIITVGSGEVPRRPSRRRRMAQLPLPQPEQQQEPA